MVSESKVSGLPMCKTRFMISRAGRKVQSSNLLPPWQGRFVREFVQRVREYEAEAPEQLEAAIAAISELEKRMNDHAPRTCPGGGDCSRSFLSAA